MARQFAASRQAPPIADDSPKAMLDQMRYSTRIGLLCVCAYFPAFGQPSQPQTDRILLRLRPAGPDGDKTALKILGTLFEPAHVEVTAGTTLDQLSQQVCGRIDHNWISATLKANPAMGTATTVARTTVLDLPPCPYWRRTGKITVPAIGTLSNILLNQMGTLGKQTVALVARVNKMSAEDLTTALHPGDELMLPYVSNLYPYKLKESYRADPASAAAVIKTIPGYTTSSDQTYLSLIAEASDSDCVAPSDESKWPFDPDEVRRVLLYNNSKRPGPPMKAVIGIADTGIDQSDDRLFLYINLREIPDNKIDDDGNGYVDDYLGVNMNRAVAGFPLLNEGYVYKEHGTHVAGLALGGLKDTQLSALTKERIALKIINIVRKTVSPSPAGSVTSWVIPNDFVLDAIQYVGQEPQIPIINLSVESAQASGLNTILSSNLSLVVAAAGNDNVNLDADERYPAAAMNRNQLLSVGAYDGSGGMAAFSNWGANDVDLVAPGCQVESIVPGSGRRKKLSGTSQAAPLVSFTAGLLYSEGLTIPQIKNRILLTTEYDPAKLGNCSGQGKCVRSQGRLNIARALDIYEDVLVIRTGGVARTIKGRIQDSCISIDGQCVGVRTVLKRLIQDPGDGQGHCWIASRANEINARRCAINTTDFQFRAAGSDLLETIATRDVIDLMPALR
jgi:subtilisin family serine protease